MNPFGLDATALLIALPDTVSRYEFPSFASVSFLYFPGCTVKHARVAIADEYCAAFEQAIRVLPSLHSYPTSHGSQIAAPGVVAGFVAQVAVFFAFSHVGYVPAGQVVHVAEPAKVIGFAQWLAVTAALGHA